MNLIEGEIVGDNGTASFVRDGYSLAIDPQVMHIDGAKLASAGGAAHLGIRPEHIGLGPPDAAGIPGRVHFLEPVGSDLYVSVDVGANPVQVRMPPHTKVRTGENVRITFDPAISHIFGSDSQNLRTDDA